MVNAQAAVGSVVRELSAVLILNQSWEPHSGGRGRVGAEQQTYNYIILLRKSGTCGPDGKDTC
ncbi:hypothetical protein BC834DRAFT_548827 [Gloeopeniophorella convolvens]|nr:hypothetical protein BC834DRAFT_548827 [Gloeopeniophorella convolvens]